MLIYGNGSKKNNKSCIYCKILFAIFIAYIILIFVLFSGIEIKALGINIKSEDNNNDNYQYYNDNKL